MPFDDALPLDGLSQADQLSWLFSQVSDVNERASLLAIVRAFVALARARAAADDGEPAPATRA